VHSGIRHRNVQRVLVGIRINRDGLDAHPARRLDDTAGDLAAIGDQNALEHGISASARSVSTFAAEVGKVNVMGHFGAPRSGEPGIQNNDGAHLWIPGSALRAAPE
jgi:hypothetical protein